MRTARRFLALAATLLFLAAPPIARGDFYATDRATDNVYRIDPKNGACTLVGNCGYDSSYSGLAYDGWTLYVSDLSDPTSWDWSLGTINLKTGDAAIIGTQNNADIHALAYKNGVMYGFSALAPWSMGTVNTATGEYVPLFDLPIDMRGADTDESTNTIYAIGSDNNLYTVDETTGTAMLVGPTGVNFNWCIGLAWYPGDGQLYAVGDDDQAGLGDGLYRINKFTGAAVWVGRTVLQQADSLEYVPVTDSFWAELQQGQLTNGGGSGYMDGTWFYYPASQWYNEWFYDHPLDMERRKVIDLSFDVYGFPPGMLEVVINWATPQWPPGGPPPLPGMFPPQMENEYIGRELVYVNLGHDEYGVQVHYEIPYNPEWISIDIRDLSGTGWFYISNGRIVHDCLPKVYRLTVNSGSGSGTYAAGTLVQIVADPEPPDSFFDIWVGDAWILDAPSSPVAIATMPPQDSEVMATYLPYEYLLTVNSGSGGGMYGPGTLVEIVADPPPLPDSFFDVWFGDVWILDNPLSPVAIATMPLQNVEVTATYTGPRIDRFYALMVQGQVVPPESGGSGYSNGTWYSYPLYGWYNQWFYDHHFDLERRKVIDLTFDVYDVLQPPGMLEVAINWATPQWPPGVPYPPIPGTFPPEMEDMYIGREVVYVNAGHSEYGIQVHYVIPYNPEWVSIDIRDVTGMGFFRISGQMVHDCVPNVYALTVNSGSGSGMYTAGTLVPIIADTPPPDSFFDIWVGDAWILDDPLSPVAIATMPAQDAAVTATYLPYEYLLTVNSGSGGGIYASGTLVEIVADPPPLPDSFFDVWVGDVWILDNPLSPVAIATMPSQNVEVTATYTGPRIDQFYALMVQGQVVPPESGGSGYGGGTWYSYPLYGWYNQWFYDHRFDPERRKVIDLTFDIYDVQAPGTIEVVINWATPQWPPGTPYPPLPGMFPPEMEDEYIGRELVYVNPGHEEYGIQVHYVIPYNPEWVSIDIRDVSPSAMGHFRIRGQMVHDCVPWGYTLTVNSGSGSGTYAAGTIVTIVANAPPSGTVFKVWVGDTAGIADTRASSTTETMPALDQTITATYKLRGDLNEDGFVGQGDLNIVLAQWGRGMPGNPPITDPRADANHDGVVGQGDLNIVLADWGKSYP